MKKILTIILALLLMVSFSYAEQNMPVWKMDNTGTIGEANKRWRYLYINDILASDIVIEGTFTRPNTKNIHIPLTSLTNNKTGDTFVVNDLSGTWPSSPILILNDGLTSLVWDHLIDPATAAIVNFRIPDDYSTGLGFRLHTSRSTASPFAVRWGTLTNIDDGNFVTTTIAQTSVAQTMANTNASNEVLTLAVNTLGLATPEPGAWVMLEFAPDLFETGLPNSYTGSQGKFEVKGLDIYYTAD
jgi:hypothetical protein